MSDAPHSFQFTSAAHQRETAMAGMWAFLATEALFFGALFLAYAFSRRFDMAGFDAGSAKTKLGIGVTNTILLVTSSLAFGLASVFIEEGLRRAGRYCLSVAGLLGLCFLLLKFGVEWPEDLRQGLFPHPGSDASRGGMALFFTFYFISTGVHGLHLLAGLLLLGWLLWTFDRISQENRTPVLVVGLYWSFVDVIWLILFPLISLVGRGG